MQFKALVKRDHDGTNTSPGVVSSFWRKNESRLPLLGAIARVVLSMPLASIGCERVFSRGALFSRQHLRNRISDEHMEMLLLLHEYYNKGPGDFFRPSQTVKYDEDGSDLEEEEHEYFESIDCFAMNI
jgi:hypothetical protein